MHRLSNAAILTGSLLALALLPALGPADAAVGALCPETESVDLITSQNTYVGEVTVCTDIVSATLIVTYNMYNTVDGWCLVETHLQVATSVNGIPQTKRGSPIPGRFDYGDEHSCAETATFEIDFAEIGVVVSFTDAGTFFSPGKVVIAAQADVQYEDGVHEGAWADGLRFVDRGSWATFFDYNLPSILRCGPCPPSICDNIVHCGESAPYECTAGAAKTGCNSDPGFWPTRSDCQACCDFSTCSAQ